MRAPISIETLRVCVDVVANLRDAGDSIQPALDTTPEELDAYRRGWADATALTDLRLRRLTSQRRWEARA